MSMLDWAIAYARRGWSVFPLHNPILRDGITWCSCGRKADDCGRSTGKHPRTIRGFKDATTDERIIVGWWSKWPDANIGIPTGKDTFDAVDLDVDDGKDGPGDWSELEKTYGDCPRTLQNLTGSGGQQLLFQHVEGFTNSTSKLARSIDTRGDGGYIVVPPSMHATGRAYAWAGDPIEPLAIMPEWVMGLLAEDKKEGNSGICLKTQISQSTQTATDAFERCKAYLLCVPDAISGNGGHGATLRAACEAFRFGLSDSRAWDILNWFNATKCIPTWKDKELRHKLSEGRKLVEKEGRIGARLDGDLTDWPISPPLDLHHGNGNGNGKLLVVHDEPEPESEAAPVSTEFPAFLLEPPGLLGDICKYMNDTAIRRQPILSLANAIAFLGVVMGRKVQTTTEARTNFYCLGVAKSGSGKDHSRKCVKRICSAAGVTGAYLAGEDVSSDSGILAAVYKNRSTLFQIDEIGDFFSQNNNRYAASHQKAIATTFTRLFTSANVLYIGKEYANQDRRDIDEPNCGIYGTTSAATLYESMTPAELNNGFLGRMLVFHSDDRPARCEPVHIDVPEFIVKSVDFWHRRQDMPIGKNSLKPRAIFTIPFTPEARSIIDAFERDCEREQARADDGGGLDVLWSRGVEHAMKLSLLVACGCDPCAKAIGREAMDYAIRLVRHLTKMFVHMVQNEIASNAHEREVITVSRLIRHTRGSGISRSQLCLRTRHLTSRQLGEILTHLIDAGNITIEQIQSTRGAPATIYKWRASAQQQ